MTFRLAHCAQWLLVGLAALAVAACGILPGENVPAVTEVAVVPDDARQLADLVGYYSRVAGMGPEEQRREYAGATQAFNRDRSAYNRVRLALLAAMPGTPFQDDARALGLLEPFAAAGANTGKVGQFGAMLHAEVSDRARARARADQLKEQLDQLRAVERAIIDRGQTPPATRQ
jgi:hypothetical protein